MLEAQRQWKGRNNNFALALRYQYTLSKEPVSVRAFHNITSSDWVAQVGNALPHCRLVDRNGKSIGLLLGIAVGPTGLIHGQAAELPLDVDAPDFFECFEHYLIETAGRFAFLVTAHGKSRFYTDPVGMIGVVYNAEEKRVASSPLLTITRPIIHHPKYDLDVLNNHGGRTTLFHTIDAGVRRLNPNCYLDLNTFDENRFWPKDEDFSVDPEHRLATYDEIYARSHFNIGEIAKHHRCALPVSGGQDSRLMLAFSRDHLEEIEQVYTHITNYATRRDAAIGAELCKTLGAAHETHDKRDFRASPRDLSKRRRMASLSYGYGGNLPKEVTNGVIAGLTDGSVVLRGHQTDLLRAVFVFKPEKYWTDPDWQLERLLIVPRKDFTAEVADQFRDDFVTWQNTLPANAMRKAADFMFLEIYYTCGIGASFPAAWWNFYLSPFNSRKLISLALSFDETSRRQSQPVFDILERFSPDLSGVPFDFEALASLDHLADPEVQTSVTQKRRRNAQSRLADLEIIAAPMASAS